MIIQIQLLVIVAIGSFPTGPHRFMGYVIDEHGQFAQDGTIVSARLHDIFFNTTVMNGKYGYESETEEFQVKGSSGDAGSTITFYINGILTEQTSNFTPFGVNDGILLNFNLFLDTTPLVISSVTISSVTSSQATITWTTNKPANSTINYGTSPSSLVYTKQDNSFVTSHVITITGLPSGSTYYFEVISYDIVGNKKVDDNAGSFYSFTTSQSTPPPAGFPPGGSVPSEGEPEENIPPVADAGGPYYGIVNEIVYFDASNSSDADGYITDYTWDLGDGTTISTKNYYITHVYVHTGNYTVYLTVTDNNQSTNVTSAMAYIFEKGSDEVPVDPDLDTDKDGLTDEEERRLGTDPYNPSDVLQIINEYGVFFLLDTRGDGIFDTYYNRTSNITTALFQTQEGTFLIDTDDNQIYEYEYFPTTNSMAPYQQQTPESTESVPLWIFTFIILIIILSSLVVLYSKKRKKI